MWLNVNIKSEHFAASQKNQGPKSWPQQKPQKFDIFLLPQILLVC